MRHLAVFWIVCFAFFSCKQNEKKYTVENTEDINTLCVSTLTDVIVHDIFSPPVASRIYAYSNLAWYEAFKYSDSNSISLTEKMKGFEPMPTPGNAEQYNFTVAAIKSFFTVAKSLVFSKDSIRKAEEKFLSSYSSLEKNIYSNSLELGEQIGNTILKRAANDNYKLTRGMPKYNVTNEPGKWQQTPPDYADAAEPHWRLIKPLLLDSSSQFKPIPPPPYNLNKQSTYYKELLEVYDVSKNLTAEQDTIARYWDDNPFVTTHEGHLLYATKKMTPGGHWMGITGILCKEGKKTKMQTAIIYALVSASMLDGFISCWDEKYRSQMVRPITVIREHLDPVWQSKLQTPPFPEYTSGHSVITSAAATVLTGMFGDNFSFTDTSEKQYLGLVRTFSSINAAANETGISRLYGGIHFRSAIEEGSKQGKRVGNLYQKAFEKLFFIKP